MNYRFKIEFVGTQEAPNWILYEFHQRDGLFGWWRRGEWRLISKSPDKADLERRIKAIVAGEKISQTTYYNHAGVADISW